MPILNPNFTIGSQSLSSWLYVILWENFWWKFFFILTIWGEKNLVPTPINFETLTVDHLNGGRRGKLSYVMSPARPAWRQSNFQSPSPVRNHFLGRVKASRARILKHLLEAKKSTFQEKPSFQRSESTTGYSLCWLQRLFCVNNQERIKLYTKWLHLYFILKISLGRFESLGPTLSAQLSFQSVLRP